MASIYIRVVCKEYRSTLIFSKSLLFFSMLLIYSLGLRLWFPFGPSLLLLPIWSIILLWRYMWSYVGPRRHLTSQLVSIAIAIVILTIILLVEGQCCLSLWTPHVFFASSIEFPSPHHHKIGTSKLLFWMSLFMVLSPS